MKEQFEWRRCLIDSPRYGSCVLGAFAGEWKTAEGGHYEVVLPMFYLDSFQHPESGEKYSDCYVDADDVVRKADLDIGNGMMKYWCALPEYPEE